MREAQGKDEEEQGRKGRAEKRKWKEEKARRQDAICDHGDLGF